jgi:hypothetical protein
MAMLTVPALEPTISEPMTWADICATYPDQWVGVVDIQKNSGAAYDIRSARVVCHSTNRGEVLDRVLPLRPRHDDARHLFTGTIRAPFPRFL